jgi:predicted RND superfamily exporter protein
MSDAQSFFRSLLKHPYRVLAPLFLLLVFSLYGLKDLRKDTRSDAFLAPDNPALVYRDLIKDQFGLSDPVLVAIVAEGKSGIYRPDVLATLSQLTEGIAALPNVESVSSLATESLITGSASGIDVLPLLDPLPTSAAEVSRLRGDVEAFPLFLGTLVARDGAAALIAANLTDESLAEEAYQTIRAVAEDTELPEGLVIHVAGEGAIAGYLGAYIDRDAQRLNPIAAMIIALIIVLAFRRLAPAMLAIFMIIGSVSAALGGMASAGIPFYVITNALPVILIGIAVADTIHIFSHFYEAQARAPAMPREELIVSTMSHLWLPITVTSLTTAAGFLGLYFAAYMPPFKYFGLFAAVGVAAAWLYSLLALPVLMKLLQVQVAQHFINQQRSSSSDALGQLLQRLAGITLRYPKGVVLFFVLLAGCGVAAVSQLIVDADRIRLFHPDEPIARADRAINTHLNGTSTLDIVIETPGAEGVFEPEVLAEMEALQRYALTLPHVRGASSIVDYIKQMNRVLNGGDAEQYVLPGSSEEVAQYMLLYSFSASPEDFSQEVDYDYRTANIRLTMNHGGFLQAREVYEAVDRYLVEHFSGSVSATLSGRVSLNYHWIRNIGESHFLGLLIALILVGGVASASFRSFTAGGYTLIPVIVAVLFVYAFMVVKGLTLGVGTSMFAAVAIGLGVDFAIHTLSRLRELARNPMDPAETEGDAVFIHDRFFATTGRALLLNVLSVACGFGVLVFSEVTQLRDFGSIVVLSMSVAFLASVTLLPAMIILTRPRFLGSTSVSACVALIALLATVSTDSRAEAQATPGAEDIVKRVNMVSQGKQVTRSILFRTTDKSGRVRERETMSFRRYFGDERRLALFFTAPANIRDTSVLTWDYPGTTEDDQWLYLPALRKVRRIPAADRGDYFLGTDFSFEDMKLDGQLSEADYDYELLPSEREGHYRLGATPKSPAIAQELGYSRTESVVDASVWVVVQADFWGVDGEHLKTLQVSDISEVDGVVTRHRVRMQNHETGHSTELIFSGVDYRTPIDRSLFTQQALRRGL